MKENKALALFLFASLLLLAVISTILTISFLQLTELKGVEQSLAAEIEQKGGQVDDAKGKLNEKLDSNSVEKTGYPVKLLEADTELVTNFFKRAFTWTGNVEYEKAHTHYIELLGEQNSFVTTYLEKDGYQSTGLSTGRVAENSAEDSLGAADEQQFIDETDDEKVASTTSANNSDNTLASVVDSVEIIPLRAKQDMVHYIAFIRYYVGGKFLLENKADLNPEVAIIELSITDTENGREINDVTAWSAGE